MPLDVCPGAQHLRAQLERAACTLPSSRLASFVVGAWGSPLDRHFRRCVEAGSHSCDCMRRCDRTCSVLSVMADIEREREDANTEAAFEADVASLETSESADPVRTAPSYAVTDPVGALGELVRSATRRCLRWNGAPVGACVLEHGHGGDCTDLPPAARAEADDENEMRSADCLERDQCTHEMCAVFGSTCEPDPRRAR